MTVFSRMDSELGYLGQGQVDVPASDIASLQGLLKKHYAGRFDAVSDRDLAFWARTNLESQQLADTYLRLNVEAVNIGTKVSRIFLFTDEDLDDRMDAVVEVLTQHQQAGIGWAVALDPEIDPGLKQNDRARDFAVLSSGEAVPPGIKDRTAVSFFRDSRDGTRRFIVLFSDAEANKDCIGKYGQQYTDIMAQCWIVDGTFKANQQARLSSAIGKRAVGARVNLVRRLGVKETVSEDQVTLEAPSDSDTAALTTLIQGAKDRVFLLEVSSTIDPERVRGEIEQKLKFLREIRKWSARWYSECVTAAC